MASLVRMASPLDGKLPARRAFLRLGSVGLLTLGGLALARRAAALVANEGSTGAEPARPIQPTNGSSSSFGRARHCILLFLTGGPPQVDTFDPKPRAPAEIRGELAPIATNMPGVVVSELFPLLARCADKLCLVRSITHDDTVHTSAGYAMLTGVRHPKANDLLGAAGATPGPDDHPHLGSLVAYARHDQGGPPAFVALPEIIKDAGVNEFPGQGGGLLGRAYDPLLIQPRAADGLFAAPGLVLPPEVDADRLAARRRLRAALGMSCAGQSETAALNACYERAFEVLDSPAVQRALDLMEEPAGTRERYGSHLFGRGCLAARRLVEAGVDLVTVYWHYEGPDDSPVWDTHRNNFAHLRQRLAPPTDQAVSALLLDLFDRGLLEETAVVCLGEFGRTPRVNGRAGRDHWPWVQSALLAGAGIPAGSVVGASDRHGAYPADCPISPADLAATLLHLLGVAPGLELTDRSGRPFAACQGTPVPALCS
jgi:hypothetical protein